MLTKLLATLFDLQHLLAQALGGGLHATLHRTLEPESGQRDRQVDGDVERDLGLVAVGCQRVRRILGLELTRADQGPTTTCSSEMPAVLIFILTRRGLPLS